MTIYDPQALATCSFCPRLCRHLCPPALGEARETLIPTHKMALLELWQKGLVPFDESLVEVFYACTDCGACTTSCKHKMEPAKWLYEGRRDAVKRNKQPDSVRALLERCDKTGSPYRKSTEHAELDYFPNAPIQLLVGGAGFQNPKALQQIQQSIKENYKQNISFLPKEKPSGLIQYAAGDHNRHRLVAQALNQALRLCSKLISLDPFHTDHLHRNFQSSKHNFSIPLQHFFEFVHEQNFPLHRQRKHPRMAFYHDSSPLARFEHNFERPREILHKLGIKIIEFTRNRQDAIASGAGGIYRWTSPKGSHQHAAWLLKEVHQYQEANQLTAPPAVVTIGETERSLLAESDPSLNIFDLNQMIAEASID